MTPAQQSVLAVHPTAFASWHQGDGCKVYYRYFEAYIGISATCATEAEAWLSAWEKLQERAKEETYHAT